MSIGPSLDQIAEPQIDPATGKRPPIADVRSQPNWLSGGGGMVSTASDYVRFSQMLLNGGELDGVRLLSPHVVAYMTSDQLPPDILFEPLAFAPTPRNGASFGLGFAVRTQRGRSAVPGEPGKFTWGESGEPPFLLIRRKSW
jgi:CubicO group peptidase (beta-lactamase class C family)